MKRFGEICGWGITFVCICQSVSFAVGLLSPNDEEQYERLDQPWNIGFSFAVNNDPIEINALGVWEDFDGLDNDIEVGIWLDFEEDPIATAIVPAGNDGILDDGFRYTLIDSIVLDPREEYVVGALVSYDGDAFNDPYNIENDLDGLRI